MVINVDLPLISIIVPIYNVEVYLERCLNSIINQDYRNIQIILINDGSTDSSGSICDKFKQKDNRIEVHSKDNGGLSSARNMGMSFAKGEYVLFVDSDDYIGPKHISNLYTAITQDSNALLAITGCTRFNDNEIPLVESDHQNPAFKIMTSEEALLIALSGKRNSPFQEHAPGKLYKKELFSYLNFPTNKHYEDRFICYKVLCQSEIIVYQNANDYFYLDNRTGSITNTLSLKTLDSLEATRTMLPYLRNKSQKVYHLVMSKYAGELIGSYIIAKQLKQEDLALNIYDEILNERSAILQLDYIPLSTRIGYLLTYLGRPIFGFIGVLNFKRGTNYRINN